MDTLRRVKMGVFAWVAARAENNKEIVNAREDGGSCFKTSKSGRKEVVPAEGKSHLSLLGEGKKHINLYTTAVSLLVVFRVPSLCEATAHKQS